MRKKMSKYGLISILLLAMVVVGFAQEKERWAALRSRYLGLKSLAGSFTETVESESGAEPIVFKGRFVFQLPHRFRLEVSEPTRQVIVGNDSVVWFYFPDEQRAVLQTQRQPVPLLGFIEPLLDTSAEVFEEREGVLVVRGGRGGFFEELKLELDKTGRRIEAFSFVDEWGNYRRFVLSNQRWNPSVSPKSFRFVPPKGTTIEYQ